MRRRTISSRLARTVRTIIDRAASEETTGGVVVAVEIALYRVEQLVAFAAADPSALLHLHMDPEGSFAFFAVGAPMGPGTGEAIMARADALKAALAPSDSGATFVNAGRPALSRVRQAAERSTTPSPVPLPSPG